MHLRHIPKLGCVIIVHTRGESLVLSIYHMNRTLIIPTACLDTTRVKLLIPKLPRNKRLYPVRKQRLCIDKMKSLNILRNRRLILLRIASEMEQLHLHLWFCVWLSR